MRSLGSFGNLAGLGMLPDPELVRPRLCAQRVRGCVLTALVACRISWTSCLGLRQREGRPGQTRTSALDLPAQALAE